jgi:hypothetical protein
MNQFWGILALFAWLAIGTYVLYRLERKLTGLTWRQMRESESAEKALLFRHSNATGLFILFWPISWPMIWWLVVRPRQDSES